MRSVFINPERYIGCRQCEFACAIEHSQSKIAATAMVEDPLPRTRIHVEPGQALNTSFPVRCHHCNPAPCEQVCPSGAIRRAVERDLVLIDIHKCIACAMCAMVCPFDAVTFYEQGNGMPRRVVATKCDGCIDRLRAGREPACVEACKVDALVFGELNELIAAGRLRQSGTALSATTLHDAAVVAPATVAAWRKWGESVAGLNEGI